MQSVTSGNSTVSYNYLTNGALNRLTAPSGTVYSFAYDTFGRTSSIAIGSRNLSSTEYLNNYSSLVNKFTYGNGVYKNYTYDNLDRVLTESINGNQILSYLYDKRGNLVRVNDLQANVVTDFVFDLIGRPQGIKLSDGQRLHISYDNLNRVSLSKWSLNGISQLTEYIYGSNTVSGQKNGLIYGVKNNGVQRLSYSYDELCRLASRTLNTTTPYITEYGYLEGSAPNTTTALVKTLKNGNDIYEYGYDDVGNITQVKLNGVTIESYTYDNLGQLTSATYNGDTYTYLYDNGGNITEVKKNGTVIKAYTYGDSEWKDLLTKFNNTDITYDTIGNPLSYRDGYSFTWANGRQLVNIEKDNNALASYTYNADGLRTSKTVNGVTTNYYWINGILQGQKTGDEYIIFLYDESGTAYGMLIKNGSTETAYYYVKNLQGDIIGILDSTGTQVVSYTYGAWGDILSVSGTLASTVGQQNPLRYRGYYYDSETGLYYVNTRYYDPEIGRWISPEPNVFNGAFDDGAGLIGYNIYTYCANNPIFLSDTTGEFIISAVLIGAGLGLLSVYAGDIIGNISDGRTGIEILKPQSSFGTYLGAGISGMIPGGGMFNSAARICVNTGVKHLSDAFISGKTIKFEKVGLDLILNTGGELASFASGKLLNKMRPQNYSSFRHQMIRRLPSITQKQTTSLMHLFNNTITNTNRFIDFSIEVVTNR